MADSPPTLVPRQARLELADDQEAGGGNVLQRAIAVSPDPHAPYLTSEIPLRYTDDTRRTEFSLAELDTLVRTWAARYRQREVGPRDRVAVYVRDSFEDLVHFFALSRIGAIPVLINGEMRPELAAGHCRVTGAIGLHTDQERRARLGDLPELSWIQTDDETTLAGVEPLAADAEYRHAAEDPVLICHSSGTTGVPKPVVWAHAQSMVGIRCHLRSFRDQPNGVVLSAMPQSHAAAMGYTALAMLTGTPLVALADRDGASVARAVDWYRATTVAAFAGLYAELAALRPEPGSFPTVESWVSVADSAHKAHIAKLVRTGRHWERGQAVPGSMFIDGLGASELGWGGVLSRITVPGTEHHDRCIGTPQPHATVAVLREDGTMAERGEVGQLGVRSASVTPGYWNDSDRTYRSKLAGYWLSGDLAYRDEHGRFYHVDRAVDAIPVPGGLAYSVVMEETLLAHVSEVDDCAVVAGKIGGQVRPVAVLRLRDGVSDSVEDLLRRANDVLRTSEQPELAWLTVAKSTEDMPLGPTGKVLKRQLRERFNIVA